MGVSLHRDKWFFIDEPTERTASVTSAGQIVVVLQFLRKPLVAVWCIDVMG